jgi:hypothetical protein
VPLADKDAASFNAVKNINDRKRKQSSTAAAW